MLVLRQDRGREIVVALAAAAQAKAKAPAEGQAGAPAQDRAQAAPVSIFNDRRSDLMNAQARMIDEPNTFEARWRARVTIE